MTILHIDGFDHYGDDEAKLTEGPYVEAGLAFSLSEANPRTGNRNIRHSTSTDQGLLQLDLGGQKVIVGTGMAAYFDQLPNIDDAYVLCDFRDQNGEIQVSAVIQSDGKIVIKRGDKSGFVIGESDANVIQAGEQQHVEIAINFDSGETESNVLIDVNHVWDFQVTSGWPTAPDPETVTIPDSGYSQGEAPFGFKGSSSTFDQPFPHVTNWDGDTFIWLRTTLIADGNSDIFISSQIENGALFYFDGEFIVADNPTNAARNANLVGAGNVEFTIDKSIATAGIHTLHVLAMDGPLGGPGDPTENTYFFATYERVNVQNVTGQLEVRVNGVTEISEVGVDTTRTENQECSFVSLFCGGGPGAHGVTTDIDDWYIWDDQGAWNNSFIGDRRCYLLKPNQDTNISDFDTSSGYFGYKMIDDDSPDDDSTYIIAEAYLQSGSPLAGTSEFEIENLPDGTSLISAINIVSRASKTDSTSAEIFTSINSGAVSLSQSAHVLTTSYKYFADIYEYDPSTISSLTRDGFKDLSISITADDLDPGVAFDSPEDFASPASEQTYNELILSLSPTAYWRLGESSGTTAFDEVGSNDGTYTNSPLLGQTGLITGDADTCVRLDGSNDLVTMGDVLNPGMSDFSVVIWINPDDLTNGNAHRPIQKRGSGALGTVSGWQISTSTGWNNTLVDAGDGSYVRITDTTYLGVTVANRAMLTLTYDNSTAELLLYVNDTLAATGVKTGSPEGKSISNSRPFTIGCSDNGGGTRAQFFDGFEDEAAIWVGTVLTPAQISDIYNKGTGA